MRVITYILAGLGCVLLVVSYLRGEQASALAVAAFGLYGMWATWHADCLSKVAEDANSELGAMAETAKQHQKMAVEAVGECELLTVAVETATKKLKEMQQENAEVEQARANFERQVKELREVIDHMQEEITTWRESYWRCGREHGNAQNLMMQERDSLLAQLRAANVKIRVNPTVESVYEAFKSEHGQVGPG